MTAVHNRGTSGTTVVVKENNNESISYSEVQKHNKTNDAWMVIDGRVYDVSKWSWTHPGGRVIMQYAGEDASDAFQALHPSGGVARSTLKNYEIGKLAKADIKSDPLVDEFRTLRAEFKRKGYFNASPFFYVAQFTSILGMEFLAYFILYLASLYFVDNNWGYVLSWFLAGGLLGTAQAQSGWLQHDFGHLSVFKNPKVNHLFHYMTVGACNGAAASWWNWRHFNHHAKPNVVGKDPDINMFYVFVLGIEPAKRWGEKKKGVLPYQFQHWYWFLIGPPLLIPIYFSVEIVHYMIKHRQYNDIFWFTVYVSRFLIFTVPFIGWVGAVQLYFFMRFIESQWFVWVTQMNHIPKHIERDSFKNWPLVQLDSTCNVESGTFNDWFTGHLNFQIEHHLFPTMPRHNYHKVAPQIRAMYEKNGHTYEVKTLYGAFSDIVASLKVSGDLWYQAYFEDH